MTMYNCVIIIIGQKAVPTNTDGPTNKDGEHGSPDNKVQLVVILQHKQLNQDSYHYLTYC